MAQLYSRTRLRPSRTARHHGLRDHLRESGRLVRPTELESFDCYTVRRLPVADAGQSPTSGKCNFLLILSPGVCCPMVTRMRKQDSVWSAASGARSARTFARPLPNSRRRARCFHLAFALPALAAAEFGTSGPEIFGSHRPDEQGSALRTAVCSTSWRSPAGSP